MQHVRDELMRESASALYVSALAHAVAVHLARNYADKVEGLQSDSPSLPGYKLRQITDWMAEHVADEFSLEQLGIRAGLSKFHFQRLFKHSTGVSPSRYQINLRINRARQ